MTKAGLCATTGLIGIVAILSVSPAFAADESAASTAEPGISEVVVTAQKRQERLIDVPQAVTVVSSNALEKIGATRLQDYVDLIPGFTLTEIGGRKNYTIRGLNTGLEISPTVAVYVDEVSVTSPSGFANGNRNMFDLGTFDLDRIEVLKGPQGTLYGVSAIGGLIKYVTPKPNYTAFGGKVLSEVSTTQDGGTSYVVSGALNAPLVKDKAAFRVSAFESHNGGYIDNVAPGFGKKNYDSGDTYGGRADVMFSPSENLDVRFTAYFQNISQDGLSTTFVTRDGAPLYGSLLNNLGYKPDGFNQKYRSYDATINYNMGFATLTSVSAYHTVNSIEGYSYGPAHPVIPLLQAGVTFPIFTAGDYIAGDLKRWTQELRLASPVDQKLQWIGGLFYTREDGVSWDRTVAFDSQSKPLLDLGYVSNPSRFEETAAFANATYHFTEKLQASAGIRYAHDVLDATSGPDRVQSKDNVVTYMANVEYHPNPNTSAYARSATGYRPGGPNFRKLDPVSGQPFGPASFGPDSVKTYEIGLKGRTADGRYSGEVAAYQTNWDNLQALFVETLLSSYRTNIPGGATVRGIELSGSAVPIDPLTFTATFTYQDPTVNEDSPELRAKKGDRLPYTPEYQGSFGFDYAFAQDGLRPTVGATLRYSSGAAVGFTSAAVQQYQVSSYTTVDLRASVDVRDVRFQLFARNVGNSRALISNNTQGRATQMRPRTIGLNATYNF